MTPPRPKAQMKTLLLSTVLAAAFAAPAFAQDTAPHRQVDGEKILQLLVAKGVISKADADGIEAQATVAPPAAAAPIPAGGVAGDIQTIPYIPETVRKQIKDELRAETREEARTEGWAQPGLIPDWLGKVRLEGDIRVRDEEDLFDKGNDPNLVNFNAINTGSPYNINRAVAGSPNPPYINSVEDRNRTRVRARFGLVAQPDDWISFEIRTAAGNDNSPVSPNQTLGASGDFSKYSVWLDRFDVMLTPKSGPLAGLRVDLGRGENPFWTTPILFYPDLNFDGFSARYRHTVPGLANLEGFGTIGAFPIYNTALNFGSNDVGAFSSRDQWLFAGQLGAAYQPVDDVKLSVAAGYFDFEGSEGKISTPCLYNQDVCNTDITRPPFAQWGNSVYPIRNITPDPTVGPGLSPDPQYFGLASAFRVLDIHSAVDIATFANFPVRLEGDFLENLAFHKSMVEARQVNVVGPYTPGGMGWMANITLGKPDVARLGDWNVSVGYRYLESDAVMDGITDADFHLGGTNAKGYVLMGYVGIGHNTNIGVRWFSADVITGPTYSNDVLQLELNTKF
jgi:hypothetical protein